LFPQVVPYDLKLKNKLRSTSIKNILLLPLPIFHQHYKRNAMSTITPSELLGSAGKWWAYLLLGAVLIAAGVWMFAYHEDTLLSINRVLCYLLLGLGVWQIITVYIGHDREPNAWWKFIVGAVEIIIGSSILVIPGLPLHIVMLLLGGWLFFRGLFLLYFSFRLNGLDGQSWIWLLAGGILVCLLGVCVLLDPTEKLTRYFWTALGALVAGAYHLMLAFQLRNIARLAKKQR
jgi:uncharacterized membrane protein HdeD (DUF308 family)